MHLQRKSSGRPATEHDLEQLAKLLAASFAGEAFYLQGCRVLVDSSLLHRFRQMVGIQRNIIDLVLRNLTNLQPGAEEHAQMQLSYANAWTRLNARQIGPMLHQLCKVEDQLLAMHKRILRQLDDRELALRLSEHTAWMQILLDRLKTHEAQMKLSGTGQDMY